MLHENADDFRLEIKKKKIPNKSEYNKQCNKAYSSPVYKPQQQSLYLIIAAMFGQHSRQNSRSDKTLVPTGSSKPVGNVHTYSGIFFFPLENVSILLCIQIYTLNRVISRILCQAISCGELIQHFDSVLFGLYS